MLPKKPQDLRGGLLADEMGLGKTLTTLSLIVTSLDNVQCRSSGLGSASNVQRDQSLKSNTCTLIVTTKSSWFPHYDNTYFITLTLYITVLDEWEDQIQRSVIIPSPRV